MTGGFSGTGSGCSRPVLWGWSRGSDAFCTGQRGVLLCGIRNKLEIKLTSGTAWSLRVCNRVQIIQTAVLLAAGENWIKRGGVNEICSLLISGLALQRPLKILLSFMFGDQKRRAAVQHVRDIWGLMDPEELLLAWQTSAMCRRNKNCRSLFYCSPFFFSLTRYEFYVFPAWIHTFSCVLYSGFSIKVLGFQKNSTNGRLL